MLSKRKVTLICLAASIALVADGCKKKIPAPPPPPPAPAPAPAPTAPAAPAVAQFSVEPTTIERGQSATLRWEVSGETSNVSINQGIGTVRATGSQQVTPTSSTTYTLTATGPGGTITASTTLTVASAAPPAPAPSTGTGTTTTHQSIEERVSSETQDAYFDYDKSDVRGDARDALTRDAAALKSILADFPNAVITVEGHCDERGSAEYNIGLGDRRASSAKDFLVSLGVPGDRLKTISYGKERPQCTESNEACWQKNRRAHLSVGQ